MIAFLKMQESHLLYILFFGLINLKPSKSSAKEKLEVIFAYILNSLGLVVLDRTFALSFSS